jgi:SAM-dependent methyltransferase
MVTEDLGIPQIDTGTPSVARMYDWLLGGEDNYAVDREACEQLLAIAPPTRELALNNRRFLERVVTVLAAEYDIRQFVDHGSGLPTRRNVHQIAQSIHPASRVVYIDNDPMVLAYAHTRMAENDGVAVLNADMLDTDAIFGSADVRRLIDPGEPTAALFVSVLHCLKDEADPAGLVRRVAERLAPGSFVVVCQLVSDDREVRDGVTELMRRVTHDTWGRVRERADVESCLAGWDLLDPGVVEVSLWRPHGDPVVQQSWEWIEYGGVARIR